MKIDSHQHYFIGLAYVGDARNAGMPALQTDCMPIAVAADMDRCGINAVIAVQARSLATETGFLLDLADANPGIVGVVGWVDLTRADLAAQLDQWLQRPKLRGFRHILQDEANVAALADAPQFNRGLSTLQQRGLSYDVLVFEHQLPAVYRLCAAHDQHWLVLDHAGKPAMRKWSGGEEVSQGWRRALHTLASMPHIACKLSGLVTETAWQDSANLQPQDTAAIFRCFDQVLEAFGSERIMFGSDWPVCQLAAPYEAVYALARDWADSRLSASEQNAFWSGNAMRCYGLDLQALVA